VCGASVRRRRALRRSGPRPPFRAPQAAPAPPVRSSARFRCEHVASNVASRGSHDRPDASLEVLVPFSARLPRRVCRALPRAPAIPLRRLTEFARATSFALMPVQHPPTEWRRPVCPCGLTRCTELARSTLRGSTPRVLIETLRRSRATLRCIDPRRAPATRVMRRRLSAPGVPLPALRFTWPGRAPLGVAKLCVFPSRERGRQRGRPFVTRVTVSLSTPVSRRRSWGCQMWPFAGLLPQAGEARVSAPSDPHAVRRCVGRSILAARPAGPVEAVGRSCLIVLRASRAKRLSD